MVSSQNNILTLLIDSVILLLSLASLYYLRDMAANLKLGRTLAFIGLGMVALALSHFVSTLWIHPYFSDQLVFGANGAMMLHHLSNLFGFALILLGYLFAGRIVRERMAVLVCLMAALIIASVAAVSLMPRLLPGTHLEPGELVVICGVILTLTMGYQPLRAWLVKVLDKAFFRYSYNSSELLQDVSRVCASTFQLESLLVSNMQIVARAMRLEKLEIALLENDQTYAVKAYADKIFALSEDDLSKLRNLKTLLVLSDATGDTKDVMTRSGVAAVAPLIAEGNFIGLMLVGDKESDEVLNQQDLEILGIIVPEIAVAVGNAKAVQEIKRFNQTLQEKVDSATEELKAGNQHLQDLDKAKDEFISMASHQLRTPLTTVKGYLSMMLDGEAGKLTENQQIFAKRSMEGSERMVYLISDLLDASRMSAGKFKITRVEADLAQTAQEEITQLQAHAKDKNLELIWHAPDGPVILPFDLNKTRQVIMNFIDNAIYYTMKGSITVTLEKTADGAAKFTVKDTGIGVPEEAKEKLFSKFYRADNAQTLRPDGTGLGLYLAKRVIEDQGGKLIFESTVGAGSTFGFTLPLHPDNEDVCTKEGCGCEKTHLVPTFPGQQAAAAAAPAVHPPAQAPEPALANSASDV